MEDIDREQLYVDTTDGVIHGVFAFILGPDPTYAHIEGALINDLPYGTIHRLASDGSVRGFFSRCLNFCKERTSNLRIDTHHDNRIMQHLLEKHGFIKCGIIYVSDASPRIAYQLSEMK